VNRPKVSTLSLDLSTLYRWIENGLNGEVFAFPVEVCGLQVDEEIVMIDIRPAPESAATQVDPAPAVTVFPAPPPAVVASPAVTVPSTNGNGHHQPEDKPAPSAEASKRRLTPDEQAAIVGLSDEGLRPSAIASRLGIKVATVYSYLERVGKPASQHARPTPQAEEAGVA